MGEQEVQPGGRHVVAQRLQRQPGIAVGEPNFLARKIAGGMRAL